MSVNGGPIDRLLLMCQLVNCATPRSTYYARAATTELGRLLGNADADGWTVDPAARRARARLLCERAIVLDG